MVSGGQGGGENITEALCMYTWLTDRGIPPGGFGRRSELPPPRKIFGSLWSSSRRKPAAAPGAGGGFQ